MRINWKALLVVLALTFGLPLLPSLFVRGGTANYRLLSKPPLSPPGWLFGVVWPVLYLLMGVAAYLVWRTGDLGRNKALEAYFEQLAVNALWTVIFFGLQNRALAFFWLLMLIALVILTFVRFRPIDNTAAYLLLPYMAWILFAAYLNLGVWLLNRQ